MSESSDPRPLKKQKTEQDWDAKKVVGCLAVGGTVSAFLYSCYRHQPTSTDTTDICKHMESLGEFRGKRVLLSWFRMAVLCDEVYSGNPWATQRFAFLVDSFRGSNCQIQFTAPSGEVLCLSSSGVVLRDAEEQQSGSMWMAIKGDSAWGGKVAEVIFRGTKEWDDALPDASLAFGCDGESLTTTEKFAQELVSFIRRNKVTTLRVGGHSLGGLRAATVGLHTTVLNALYSETSKHDAAISLLDMVQRQIRVTTFDPPGTTSFRCDGGDNRDLMKARAGAISIICYSTTIVSEYTTEHISRPYVFVTKRGTLQMHRMTNILTPIAECLMGKRDFSPDRQPPYKPPRVPATGLTEEERVWWIGASWAWASLEVTERTQA